MSTRSPRTGNIPPHPQTGEDGPAEHPQPTAPMARWHHEATPPPISPRGCRRVLGCQHSAGAYIHCLPPVPAPWQPPQPSRAAVPTPVQAFCHIPAAPFPGAKGVSGQPGLAARWVRVWDPPYKLRTHCPGVGGWGWSEQGGCLAPQLTQPCNARTTEDAKFSSI